MTDRHVFDDHTTLVLKSLQGLVASQPNLSLIPSIKTVIDADHDESKVSLICGGGAGHEPGSTGFVGRGLLAASVSGDTFASPSARQVSGAVKAIPSTNGTLLIITNYTGDNLHFGLACQQARANGLSNIAILPVGDDVSVGRTKGALVGRRAMWTFDKVQKLGRGVTGAIASIGCTLGHCHDTVEIGLGLHNEPGVWVVKPQPSSTDLIARMLKLILDKDDPERAFVPFDASDVCVLLVNNMGGMSVLEMYAVVDEALVQLKKVGLIPARVFCGPFMTSLNAPGFSLTLLNLTHISKSVSSVEELLAFVDAPHASAAWPSTSVYPVPEKLSKRTREEKFVDIPAEHKLAQVGGPTLKGAFKVMRHGAEAVLASEPDLTRWDTIVGDGDCGETCAAGAQGISPSIGVPGLSNMSQPSSQRWTTALDRRRSHEVLRLLTELIDDTCGGTLGAIFSIFLAALTTEVRARAAGAQTADLALWGAAGTAAIETLKQSTAARVGHRTGPAFEDAVEACREGGEGTAALVAKLGRATYVGDNGNLPPDPGAMSLVFLTAGMLKGLKE
ncbi:hypothetical protein B0H17DRAFT_1080731 [Mycena rosella]|uniref:Dihydroxyacetone kinase n=1 Tax=Mycena rosella TaxID=1033263 RepID=A0AAD7D3U8_MYCRO|nr:hypothetical protein B0H17DRAFT_1080731 [Mycena rosella]